MHSKVEFVNILTMNKKYLLVMLCLGGCSVDSYRPQLAAQPSDLTKYESDRNACIEETKLRSKRAIAEYQSSGRWLMSGLFGAAGGVVDTATAGEADYNKSGYTMMDECLAQKGYKLAN